MPSWRPSFPSHTGGVEGLLKLLGIGKPGRSQCVRLLAGWGGQTVIRKTAEGCSVCWRLAGSALGTRSHERPSRPPPPLSAPSPRGGLPLPTPPPHRHARLLVVALASPYLVDPASSICLSQRLSHACLSTHGRYSETANGSLNQLWFLWSLAPLLLG